jgi:DNA-binding response OmpR family regulator
MIAPRCSILLIDDDVYLGKLIRLCLEPEGHEVLLATDGDIGLTLAEEAHPNCILLDLMMPYRSGMDVYLDLQNNPRTSGIPIVVFSASLTQRDEEAWRGLPQVIDVVQKPFDMQHLIQTLDAVCAQPSA